MLTPDTLALTLFTTIETIAEPAVRVAWLRSTWVGSSPSEVASVLEVAATGADAGMRMYRDGLLALTIALAPPEYEGVRHAAAEHAIVHRLERARGLLVPETIDPGAEPRKPSSARQPVVPGRTVTLGERKSLARGRSPATLERLLADPHPDVIRILLSNPSIREIDVLRICSKRGVDEAILREILIHPRWFVRYAIRLSLVQNPSLPTTLGLALVRTLLRQDAESIATNTTLSESLRSVASAELDRPSIH